MIKVTPRSIPPQSWLCSALCVALSVAALACSSDPSCAPIPCPAPGFDPNTCQCRAPSSPSGAGGDQSTLPAATTACDPLSAQTSPVTLNAGDIIAAGRDDADRAVYVLTEQGFALRLFVAAGDTLNEVFESGTGQGTSDSGRFWTFGYDDDAMQVTVEVQEDARGVRRMGIVKGPLSGKGFDVGSVGDELVAIDPAAATAMPAQTTQTFHIEFSGSDEGNHEIVVIAPDHASNFDGFRIFYGSLDALTEQSGTVTVTRGLSIPTTTFVAFTLDGSPATLQYGAAGDTLLIGASDTTLTASSAAAVPARAAFQCLK
jgi:hypothetical protein